MKSTSIFRQLRAYNVPIDQARAAAERYGDESGVPTPTQKLAKLIKRAARKKAVEFERKKYRLWCQANGLPMPVFEYQFAKETFRRHWRWDICWPDVDGDGGVSVEVDGGAWTQGRHTRGAGFIEDQKKRAAGVQLGWRILNVTPDRLHAADTLSALKSLLLNQVAA